MLIKHFPPTTPNLGDSLLGRGTRRIIAAIFGKAATIMGLSSHRHPLIYKPEQFGHPVHGVSEEAIQLGGRPDVLVWGGGPIWGSDRLLELGSTLRNHIQDIPIWVIGVGGWNYKDPEITSLRPFFSQIQGFSARDLRTADMAKQALPQHVDVVMTGCPALFLDGQTVKEKPEKNYFLISFRDQKIPEHLRLTADRVRQIEKRVGCRAVIAFHDYRDLYEHAAYYQAEAIPFLGLNEVDNALEVYHQAAFALTYRLHGEIISATTGTPYFHLAMDDRGYYFGQTFDPDSRYHHYLHRQDISFDGLVDCLVTAITPPFTSLNQRLVGAKHQMAEFINRAQVRLREIPNKSCVFPDIN